MLRERRLAVRILAIGVVILALAVPLRLVAQGLGNQDDRGPSGPPDPCDQLTATRGQAEGLHRRCEAQGGGGGAAKGDFNGDGYGDLAVGVPYEDQNGINAVGGVNIIYGSGKGLTATSDQFVDITTFALSYGSDDHFGWSLASGNFNGDAYADLAIGVPDRDSSSRADVGIVLLLDGSATGLNTGTARRLSLLSGTLGGAGTALVWADFNGDGFGDLAVGIPGTVVTVSNDNPLPFICSLGDVVAAGEVQVFYGSTTGLAALGAQRLRQGSIDGDFCNPPSDVVIGAFPGRNDRFGSTLAAGDFNADGKADLAIGVPEDLVETDDDFFADAGLVQIVPGSSGGLVRRKTQLVSQATAGIGGGPEDGDQFGRSLAVGDFNADLHDDLAIGVPFEDLVDNTKVDAGVVHVLLGSFATGELVTSEDSLFISQAELSGVAVEAGDRFGWALATGRFDSDFQLDLAIGVPGEAVGSVAKAGIVQVLYGSGSGPSLTRVQTWHQNTANIPDSVESGDQFGYALSAWNYGSDERSDLAIGAPFEDFASLIDAGTVTVIYGSPTGLATAFLPQLWHQDVSGINDVAQDGDRFGNVLY